MVPISELKDIVVLEQFTDDQLTKLRPIVNVLKVNQDDMIFREGDKAENFYMINHGKVLLEKHLSKHVTVGLGAIKTRYAFGWSALLGDIPFQMDAKCAEKSEIFTASAKDLFKLFEEDKELGYIFMRHLGNMMKNRLDRMEDRLFRALKEHPDFEPIL